MSVPFAGVRRWACSQADRLVLGIDIVVGERSQREEVEGGVR